MTLIYFILTYIAVTIGTRFTSLSEYQWFRDLESKLLYKYPNRTKLINDFFSFKLFHCNPCQSFWLSYPIFSLFYNEQMTLVLAILLYLFKQSEKQNGTDNNTDDTNNIED